MELLDRIQFSYNVCDQDVKDITEGTVNTIDKSVWYIVEEHEMFVHACKSKLLNGTFPDRYAMKH